MPPVYDRGFYDYVKMRADASASRVVPLLVSLVEPTSVVDVGCGRGTWLAAFGAAGVHDVEGYDGAWVDLESLEIPRTCFHVADVSRPIAATRTFDLALCLEVAEHLPANAAEPLVDSLARLAPVVAFSAAIPGQGGTNHLNEQWPDYWASKFEARGYRVLDLLRPVIWEETEVAYYYAQNLVLFCRDPDRATEIKARAASLRGRALNLVHPRLIERILAGRVDPRDLTALDLIKLFPAAARRTLRRRLRRLAARLGHRGVTDVSAV